MPFLRHATTDAKNVLVGRGTSATQAKRVMVGTGSSAVEVWPGIEDVEYIFNFPNQDELKWAPITGFDGRTASNSKMAPGFIFNDMFVAGDNPAPSYHVRLVDRQVNLNTLRFDVVLGDAVSSREHPSFMILASNINFTQMLIAEFGSEGVALRTVINGVAGTPSVKDIALSSGDTLGISWSRPSGDRVYTYRNGASTGSFVFSAATDFVNANGRMYPGFGLYSTQGKWSTRLQSVKIKGKSSYRTVLAASEFLARVSVPNAVWTKVAESKIHTGGTTNVYLVGASWAQASSLGDRFFRILVNGTQIGITPDEGGNLSLSNVNLPPESVVTVWAIANTTTATHRVVSGGVLRIGDPTLLT